MNSTNNIETEAKASLPGKLSLAVAALLSCILTVGSVIFFDNDLLTSAVCFIAGSAVFSFLLIFVRHPIAVFVPVLSAAISLFLGERLIIVSTVACAVTVFAVMYTVCHMKLLVSFRQFLITALCYTVAGGGLFLLILDRVYGSVDGGIIAFGNKIASAAPALAEMAKAEGMDYEMALAMFTDLLEGTSIYLPAIIFSLGIVCAWLMRGFFSMYTRISGLPSLFSGRQSSAPKALAVIFLILSFFGIILAVLPDSTFYALSNARSVISVIFIGEGARLFFLSFSHRAKRRAHPGLIIGALILVFFFPVIVPIILPYYGAFGVLFARKYK